MLNFYQNDSFDTSSDDDDWAETRTIPHRKRLSKKKTAIGSTDDNGDGLTLSIFFKKLLEMPERQVSLG